MSIKDPKILLLYILLLLMVIIWSFSFIIVDIALDFTTPLSIALYRYIIASISFIIINIYVKLNQKSIQDKLKNNVKNKFTRNEWILIVIASFTGVSLFFFAQYSAINLIGPSLPALFVCLLAPVIISFLALLFFNEKLSKIKIIGFVIASIGAFFLITGGNIETLTPQSPNFLGFLLAIFTPVLWALYSTSTKQITKEKSSLKMLEYICYLGTIELFIFVIIYGEFFVFISNLTNIIVLLCCLYLGLGSFILGTYIWQNSQKNLKSSKVASFLYIEPFITLFFAFLLQRSGIIFLWNIIGGVIVLIAVIIINHE
ncbi:MAG: DMT family transporter [Candidatus Hermodarchaeota archaeon]